MRACRRGRSGPRQPTQPGKTSTKAIASVVVHDRPVGYQAAMTGPVRLVATDLDGTLLRPDGTLSERTVAAVRRARDAGLHVVPVTGRPPRVTWDVAKEAGLGPLGVCCNGAAVIDLDAMEVLETQAIAAEVAADIVHAVRELWPETLFAADQMDCFVFERGFMDPAWGWDDRDHQVADIAKAIEPSCLKLIVRRPGWDAVTLLSQLRVQMGDSGHITSSGLDWVEIGAPGISKAYAAGRVCSLLGVGVDEVLAIGDNHNDLTILAWAGRAAAPANAIPEVLAVVHEVLPANSQDGVAQLLEDLVSPECQKGVHY